MRLSKGLGVTILATGLLVAVSTAAKPRDSKDVLLHFDATVGSTHLTSGNYSVKWVTHSPEATVTFMKGNKVVATAEGKVINRGTVYKDDEVVYNELPNGSRSIQEIRFHGSNDVIVFQE